MEEKYPPHNKEISNWLRVRFSRKVRYGEHMSWVEQQNFSYVRLQKTAQLEIY